MRGKQKCWMDREKRGNQKEKDRSKSVNVVFIQYIRIEISGGEREGAK